MLVGRPLLSQRWCWFVCVGIHSGRGGGTAAIGVLRHRPRRAEICSNVIDSLPSPGPTNSPNPKTPRQGEGAGVRGIWRGCPHHPLAVAGKAVCLRDAPSSPRGGAGSSVLLVALGEEGVRDDWCYSSSAPSRRNPPQSPSTNSPLPARPTDPAPPMSWQGEGVGVRAERRSRPSPPPTH